MYDQLSSLWTPADETFNMRSGERRRWKDRVRAPYSARNNYTPVVFVSRAGRRIDLSLSTVAGHKSANPSVDERRWRRRRVSLSTRINNGAPRRYGLMPFINLRLSPPHAHGAAACRRPQDLSSAAVDRASNLVPWTPLCKVARFPGPPNPHSRDSLPPYNRIIRLYSRRPIRALLTDAETRRQITTVSRAHDLNSLQVKRNQSRGSEPLYTPMHNLYT